MIYRITCILLLIAFVIIPFSSYAQPTGPHLADDSMEFFRGRVVSVQDKPPAHDFATLDQEAKVLITSGPLRGETVTITSSYSEDNPYLRIYLEKDMEIILVAFMDGSEASQIYLHDVARESGVYYMLAIFIFLLLVIGSKKGLKTIITLSFTGLVIFRVILPLLLQGYEPIPVATLSAMVIIVFTLLVIGGLNYKSLSAIVGTIGGIIVAGLLALWVGEISHLTGFSSEHAQMLMFMDQPINIRGLLFAGIIIGSLGAVTDVGMSVASAAAEVKQAQKNIGTIELIKAGMNVGRDIMGTMSNTLLLAYVGAATPLLLLMMGYEMQWLEIINMDLIATEFVRGLAGSIGLIVSIPITAVVAGITMTRRTDS